MNYRSLKKGTWKSGRFMSVQRVAGRPAELDESGRDHLVVVEVLNGAFFAMPGRVSAGVQVIPCVL
jgi:hypothetical protein